MQSKFSCINFLRCSLEMKGQASPLSPSIDEGNMYGQDYFIILCEILKKKFFRFSTKAG